MHNIASLRDSAELLFDQGKYEAAYNIYDVVYNQIWIAVGNIQHGMNQFSQNYLGNSFSNSLEFRKNYILHASNSVFLRTFNLDTDETLNEFIFAVYGRLQCICISSNLFKEYNISSILSEFLILYTLVLHNGSSDWITALLKLVTPFIEDNRIKKIRTNLTENAVKELLVKEAKKN